MSDNPQFWTKVGVERHMLPSGVAEYSTTQSYAVGSWVWSSVAATPGLYVCKTAITYTPGGAPNPWDATKWSSMQDVSSLFSDNNPSMAAKQPKIISDGILKGNGSGGISVAEPGTDYLTTHQDVSGKANKSDFSLTSQGVPSESYVASLFTRANTSLMGVARYATAPATAALADRTCNAVTVAASAVSLTFPASVDGKMRDFLVYIDATDFASGGSFTITLPSGATQYGDDFPAITAAGEHLLAVTEIAAGKFFVKSIELSEVE